LRKKLGISQGGTKITPDFYDLGEGVGAETLAGVPIIEKYVLWRQPVPTEGTIIKIHNF